MVSPANTALAAAKAAAASATVASQAADEAAGLVANAEAIAVENIETQLQPLVDTATNARNDAVAARGKAQEIAGTLNWLGVDTDGIYFLSEYAGQTGSTIQLDTDGVYYISNGA